MHHPYRLVPPPTIINLNMIIAITSIINTSIINIITVIIIITNIAFNIIRIIIITIIITIAVNLSISLPPRWRRPKRRCR